MKAWRVVVPDKLIAIEKARTKVILDRPIIIGQAILDISKVVMYQMHYEIMRPYFHVDAPFGVPDFCRLVLCYCDTDSFVYIVRGLRGRSVYRDLITLQTKHDIWDLSEIQDKKNHPLTCRLSPEEIKRNEKQLGKFKDEMKGLKIAEAVFLRPKMYSIKLSEEMVMPHHNKKKDAMGKKEKKREISKRKGLPHNLPLEKDRLLFAHQEYKDIYLGKAPGKVTFPLIRHTKNLALYTAVQTKAGLASLDDKSFWPNAASCLRYGHYWIDTFMHWLEDEAATNIQLEQQNCEMQELEAETMRMLTQMSIKSIDEQMKLSEVLYEVSDESALPSYMLAESQIDDQLSSLFDI